MKDINYDALLLVHPEVVDAIGGSLYDLLNFFVISWMLWFALIGTLLLKAGRHYLPDSFGRFTSVQQCKVVFWTVEACVGVVSIVELALWTPKCILYQGTIHSSLVTGEPDMNWRTPVGWVQNMNPAVLITGWAVTPLLLAYLFKLCLFVEEYRLRPLNVLHHIICIGLYMFVLTAILSTLDGKWMQLAIVFSLNIALEFPISIALIMYRFKLRVAAKVFPMVVVYEIVLRLAIWIGATINYYHICFQPTTLTRYGTIWRVCYPFLLLTVFTIEIHTVLIHLSLCKRSKVYVLEDSLALKESPQGQFGREDKPQGNTTAIGTKRRLMEESQVSAAKEDADDDGGSRQETVETENESEGIMIDKVETEGEPKSQTTGNNAIAPPKTKSSMWWKPAPNTANLIIGVVIVATFSNPYVLRIAERDEVQSRKRSPIKIAIVGGGIAGMGAAFAFKQAGGNVNYDVDLFEAQPELGGAAKSYYGGTELYQSPVVEHAVLAFVEYYNFETLLDFLEVDYNTMAATFTVQYDTPVPFSNQDTPNNTGEILGSALPFYFTNRNRIFKYREEIHLLAKQLQTAFENWSEASLMEVTLGEFTNGNYGVYSKDFLRDYMTPCLETYVSTGASLFDMPISLLLTFDKRFRLCFSTSRVKYHTITKGTSAYVEKLRQYLIKESNQNTVHIHLNNGVVAAEMSGGTGGGNVRLLDSKGAWREYDHVIFTLQRPLLRAIFDHESSQICYFTRKSLQAPCTSLYETLFPRDLLGSYSRTIIHSDRDFVTRVTADLSTPDKCHNTEGFNFVLKNVGDKANELRYINVLNDMNRDSMLCNENLNPPFKLNTEQEMDDQTLEKMGISPDKILEKREWLHPSHDVSFFRLGRASHAVQGLGGFWFGGAAFNFNFHEEAFLTGLVLAERLGAGYFFENKALAKMNFLRARAWMLYGLNPMMPPTVKRGD